MKDDYSFISEKIKERPLNIKKILILVPVILSFGLLFGVAAALAYMFSIKILSPVSKEPDAVYEVRLSGDEAETVPEESVSKESVLKESVSKELVSKELVSEESVLEEEITVSANQLPEENVQIVNNTVNTVPFTVDDFEKIYRELYEKVREAEKSILPVTGVKSDTDWFYNEYENQKQGSGLVIADNGLELLILIDQAILEGAEDIRVTLPDGSFAPAVLKKLDENTDLSVIAVNLSDISEDNMKQIVPAKLGSSKGHHIIGRNVMALGSPIGIQNSVCYGIVTSASELVQLTDTNVHMITTDIYGSSSGSGILVDFDGKVIGIITQDNVDETVKNLITAYGISDIKNVIEKMSNGQDTPVLGIYGADVSKEAEQDGVPSGVYVSNINLDSPAMESGLLSGDVIVKFGTTDISNFSDFKNALNKAQPGDETVVTVMRYVKGEYQEKNLQVKLR